MPTASEKLIWGQGDSSTIPVIETSAERVGAAICWENYMPLIRGGSVIISPMGEIIAGSHYNQEGLISVEIDFDDPSE